METKKKNSRWKAGNSRYQESQKDDLARYREPKGWRAGARIKTKGA